MTPQPQQKQDYLTECHCFSEEEYPYCNDRAMPCRYKDQFSRRRCPDYKSVIHHQVECDVRNGTMFAQQMVSDALGEPIYSRPSPDCMKCTKAADGYCLGKEEGAAQAREEIFAACCKDCPIKNEEMGIDDQEGAESCEGCLIRNVFESLRTGGERE